MQFGVIERRTPKTGSRGSFSRHFGTNIKAKRIKVIEELVETEKAYCNDLDIIVNVFLEPLEQVNLLPKSSIDAIFSNVRDIQKVTHCHCLNEKVNRLFCSNITRKVNLGNIASNFVRWVVYFILLTLSRFNFVHCT